MAWWIGFFILASTCAAVTHIDLSNNDAQVAFGDQADVTLFRSGAAVLTAQSNEFSLLPDKDLGVTITGVNVREAWRQYAAMGSFNPTLIPMCTLWLDASDANSTSLSGIYLSQWRDKSGKGLHCAPPTGKEPWIDSSKNGRSVMTFDRSVGLQQCARMGQSPGAPIPTGARSWSLTTVFLTKNLAGYRGIFDQSGATPVNRVRTTFTFHNTKFMFCGESSDVEFPLATVTDAWYIATLVAYVDSVLKATVYVTSSTGLYMEKYEAAIPNLVTPTDYGYVISGKASLVGADEYFGGKVAEVIAHSRALHEHEINNMHRGLNAKWAINSAVV